MEFFRLILILGFVSILQGCLRVYSPDAEVIEAKLISPRGIFKLQYTNEKSPQIYGDDGKYPVRLYIFPFYGVSHIQIKSTLKPKITIIHDSAIYQLNGGEKIKLNITPSAQLTGGFDIESPAPMDFYTTSGGSLHVRGIGRDIDREHIKKMQHETYRYYIPFNIENEKYAVDVTFRLDAKSSLEFRVPATP